MSGGGAARPFPKDGGAEEFRGNPTVDSRPIKASDQRLKK